MLFDHGCDAFGLIFILLAVARIVCLDNKETILYVGFVGAHFGFYFSVWCQYYSKGIMILGEINAVDDGIPAVWILSFITFVFGQKIWVHTFAEIWDIELAPNICFAYIILLSSIRNFCFYWFLVQIWSLLNLSKNNFTKDYKGALFDLLHVLFIIISLICIIEYSDLYQRYFYEVYLSLTIMFVRNIIYMQLCVTAEMKYNQFQPSTLLFVIGYPCNFLVIFSVHFYFFKNGSLFNYFYLLITCFYCCRFCILCY